MAVVTTCISPLAANFQWSYSLIQGFRPQFSQLYRANMVLGIKERTHLLPRMPGQLQIRRLFSDTRRRSRILLWFLSLWSSNIGFCEDFWSCCVGFMGN